MPVPAINSKSAIVIAGRWIIWNLPFLDLDLHEQEVMTWLVRVIMVHNQTLEMKISPSAIWNGCITAKGELIPRLKTRNAKFYETLNVFESRGYIARSTNWYSEPSEPKCSYELCYERIVAEITDAHKLFEQKAEHAA